MTFICRWHAPLLLLFLILSCSKTPERSSVSKRRPLAEFKATFSSVHSQDSEEMSMIKRLRNDLDAEVKNRIKADEGIVHKLSEMITIRLQKLRKDIEERLNKIEKYLSTVKKESIEAKKKYQELADLTSKVDAIGKRVDVVEESAKSNADGLVDVRELIQANKDSISKLDGRVSELAERQHKYKLKLRGLQLATNAQRHLDIINPQMELLAEAVAALNPSVVVNMDQPIHITPSGQAESEGGDEQSSEQTTALALADDNPSPQEGSEQTAETGQDNPSSTEQEEGSSGGSEGGSLAVSQGLESTAGGGEGENEDDLEETRKFTFKDGVFLVEGTEAALTKADSSLKDLYTKIDDKEDYQSFKSALIESLSTLDEELAKLDNDADGLSTLLDTTNDNMSQLFNQVINTKDNQDDSDLVAADYFRNSILYLSHLEAHESRFHEMIAKATDTLDTEDLTKAIYQWRGKAKDILKLIEGYQSKEQSIYAQAKANYDNEQNAHEAMERMQKFVSKAMNRQEIAKKRKAIKAEMEKLSDNGIDIGYDVLHTLVESDISLSAFAGNPKLFGEENFKSRWVKMSQSINDFVARMRMLETSISTVLDPNAKDENGNLLESNASNKFPNCDSSSTAGDNDVKDVKEAFGISWDQWLARLYIITELIGTPDLEGSDPLVYGNGEKEDNRPQALSSDDRLTLAGKVVTKILGQGIPVPDGQDEIDCLNQITDWAKDVLSKEGTYDTGGRGIVTSYSPIYQSDPENVSTLWSLFSVTSSNDVMGVDEIERDLLNAKDDLFKVLNGDSSSSNSPQDAILEAQGVDLEGLSGKELESAKTKALKDSNLSMIVSHSAALLVKTAISRGKSEEVRHLVKQYIDGLTDVLSKSRDGYGDIHKRHVTTWKSEVEGSLAKIRALAKDLGDMQVSYVGGFQLGKDNLFVQTQSSLAGMVLMTQQIAERLGYDDISSWIDAHVIAPSPSLKAAMANVALEGAKPRIGYLGYYLVKDFFKDNPVGFTGYFAPKKETDVNGLKDFSFFKDLSMRDLRACPIAPYSSDGSNFVRAFYYKSKYMYRDGCGVFLNPPRTVSSKGIVFRLVGAADLVKIEAVSGLRPTQYFSPTGFNPRYTVVKKLSQRQGVSASDYATAELGGVVATEAVGYADTGLVSVQFNSDRVINNVPKCTLDMSSEGCVTTVMADDDLSSVKQRVGQGSRLGTFDFVVSKLFDNDYYPALYNAITLRVTPIFVDDGKYTEGDPKIFPVVVIANLAPTQAAEQ